MKEKIEEGFIISKRMVLPIGGSKGITLSKKWLDIQKWLGREVTELISIADDAIILVSPEKEEMAKEILRQIKKSGKYLERELEKSE